MIKITSQPFPAHLPKGQIHNCHTKQNFKFRKKQKRLSYSKLPDFYADVGRIEGYLSQLVGYAGSGNFCVFITNLSCNFTGELSLYSSKNTQRVEFIFASIEYIASKMKIDYKVEFEIECEYTQVSTFQPAITQN